MAGIGVPELGLILLVGLVVFGPGKLPGVGKALGRSIREFKHASAGEQSASRQLEQADRPQESRKNS